MSIGKASPVMLVALPEGANTETRKVSRQDKLWIDPAIGRGHGDGTGRASEGGSSRYKGVC